MTGQTCKALALIVQSRPYQNRVARANIDLALAAAAMDFELHVYFSGDALMQLALERDSGGAMLPAGYRAWAALPELAETVVYAEQAWVEYCRKNGVELVMPVLALSPSGLKSDWRRHVHAMVI
jgi:sulfur relay (sulfurtransferase) DsrF/TusC family protein